MLVLRFENALNAPQLKLIQSLGKVADAHGIKLWAVGGLVRDALLGVPVVDIDLTSEAPAQELGHALTSSLGGSISSVTPFGTVKLAIEGQILDLATMRTEVYPSPASLPLVASSTLTEDLKRRDFTINAMAISLAPSDFGAIVDPHDGRADLEAHLIRAMHVHSFQDDPTRAFRAVRYAVRLGFHIERHTARWMRHGAPLIERVSGTRIRREIERMIEDGRGSSAIASAYHHGLLAQIHPALGANAIRRTIGIAVRTNLQGLELLAALMYPLSTGEVATLITRLSLPKQEASLAEAAVRIREAESTLKGAAPSEVDLVVGKAPIAAITAASKVSLSPLVRASLRRYVRRTMLVIRHLDGETLSRIGVPTGPQTGQVLQALRGAELNNTVRSRQGAIHFVRHWLETAKATGEII